MRRIQKLHWNSEFRPSPLLTYFSFMNVRMYVSFLELLYRTMTFSGLSNSHMLQFLSSKTGDGSLQGHTQLFSGLGENLPLRSCLHSLCGPFFFVQSQQIAFVTLPHDQKLSLHCSKNSCSPETTWAVHGTLHTSGRFQYNLHLRSSHFPCKVAYLQTHRSICLITHWKIGVIILPALTRL